MAGVQRWNLLNPLFTTGTLAPAALLDRPAAWATTKAAQLEARPALV